MLPIYDMTTDAGRTAYAQRLARLRGTASADSDAGRAVAAVLADVRERGDEAVITYMQKWTDPGFTADRIRVPPGDFEAADTALTGELRDAIERAIAHVRQYQEHVRPADPEPVTIEGAELGLRWSPVDSVGLCVPGGTAVLFSTLIMLAVPALVAGVPAERISVIHPPSTRGVGGTEGSAKPQAAASGAVVLAVCRMLGIERVYRIGGAQGVAALAYGTGTVEPVDLIAGPGNVFVQLAKAQVAGICGTDGGFYGPSEIVTVADGSADAARVASDLIAQAEHDPGKCFLVAWQREVIEEVLGRWRRRSSFSRAGRRSSVRWRRTRARCLSPMKPPRRSG